MKSKKASTGAHQPEVSKCHSPAVGLGRMVPIPTQGNSTSVVAGKSDSFNKVTICNRTLRSERGLKPQSQVGKHQLGPGRWAQEKDLIFLLLTSFPKREKNTTENQLAFWTFKQTWSQYFVKSVCHIMSTEALVVPFLGRKQKSKAIHLFQMLIRNEDSSFVNRDSIALPILVCSRIRSPFL